MERYRGHHHARRKEQPPLESQGALVMQDLLPPMADHVLRNVDRHHIPRALAPEVPDVIDDRVSHLPVRRGNHLERNAGVGLLPDFHQPRSLIGVDRDRKSLQSAGPRGLGKGERPQRRFVQPADQHNSAYSARQGPILALHQGGLASYRSRSAA